MKTNKSIIDLIIDLENVNKKLEQIKDPNSGYIDAKVNEIWPEGPGLTADQKTQLDNILSLL